MEINEANKTIKKFYDPMYVSELIDSLIYEEEKTIFIATVLVRLERVSNVSVIEFVKRIFCDEIISVNMSGKESRYETRIVIKKYDVPLKSDVEKILEKCMLLNTYISYFINSNIIKSFDILFQLLHFDYKKDIYSSSKIIDLDFFGGKYHNKLFINKVVYFNTQAKDLKPNLKFFKNEMLEYDFIYKETKENFEELFKLVNFNYS